MWKSTEGKAQDGKRIEGGVECKPRKILWVAGQDDGPCRQKDNLNEGMVSSKHNVLVLVRSITTAEA